MANEQKEISFVDKVSIALQLHDRQVLDNETFYDIVGLDIDGKPNDTIWKDVKEVDKASFLTQMYDKKIIEKEILLEVIFGI